MKVPLKVFSILFESHSACCVLSSFHIFSRIDEQCPCVTFGQEVLQPFWTSLVIHNRPLFDNVSLECGNVTYWPILLRSLSGILQLLDNHLCIGVMSES